MAALIFAGDAYRDRCAEIGAFFHGQLEQLIGHEPHPDDLDHNLMVGQALLLGVEYDAPLIAERLYNEWASVAGYARCSWLGTVDLADGWRGWLIDAGHATVAVDASFRLTKASEVICL